MTSSSKLRLAKYVFSTKLFKFERSKGEGGEFLDKLNHCHLLKKESVSWIPYVCEVS